MFYQNLSVIWSKVFHSNTRYQFCMNSVLGSSGSISASLSEVIGETLVGSSINKLDQISLLIIVISFVRLGNFFCLGDIFWKYCHGVLADLWSCDKFWTMFLQLALMEGEVPLFFCLLVRHEQSPLLDHHSLWLIN